VVAARPGRTSPPGKTRYPLYRRLGGSHGWSGQVRKISPPPGFDPRTVQPVAQSLYRLSYRAHHHLCNQYKYPIRGDQVPSNTTQCNYSFNIHSRATCFDLHQSSSGPSIKMYRPITIKMLKMHVGSCMLTIY
jgi:hypothetical protein